MTTYNLTANTKTSYDTFSNNDITLLNRRYMTTYNLTANAKTTYGAVSTSDISVLNKIQNLENKVNAQSEKLNEIVKLLNALPKEKSIT